MNRDIGRNISTSIKSAISLVAPTNLSSSDVRGADAFCLQANPSAVGGAGGTLTLEHSDDDIAFVVAPPAEVMTDSNVLAVGIQIQVGYRGSKRYVRGVVTPVVSVTANVVAVGGEFSREPQVAAIA